MVVGGQREGWAWRAALRWRAGQRAGCPARNALPSAQQRLTCEHGLAAIIRALRRQHAHVPAGWAGQDRAQAVMQGSITHCGSLLRMHTRMALGARIRPATLWLLAAKRTLPSHAQPRAAPPRFPTHMK